MSEDGDDICEGCVERDRVIRRLLRLSDEMVLESFPVLRGQALMLLEQRDAARHEAAELRAEVERTRAAAVDVIAEHVGRRA